MVKKIANFKVIFCFLFTIVPLAAFVQEGNPADNEVPLDTSDINSKISYYLNLSNDLINKNLDSAILYAEIANQLIRELSSDSVKTVVYKNIGDVYVARGNYSYALEFYFKAKNLSDDAIIKTPGYEQLYIRQSDLLIKIGLVHFYQKDYDHALNYFEEGLRVLESVIESSDDPNVIRYKIRIFNNIASVFILKDEYETALNYFITAYETSKTISDKALESSLLNNIGICFLEKRDFDQANHHFQQSLAIRKSLGDMRGEAQCYNNIGKNFAYNGNFNKAKEYFLKALNLGRKIGNMESIRLSLESLSTVYDTLGDYKSAFKAYKEFKTISDSLFSAQNMNRIAQLEMQYKFDKQQKLFDLELKRRETEKQKLIMTWLILGGLLFFLLLIAILLIYLQRSKIRNSELEKEKLNLEKQKLREDLEYRNRELTANVMYLLKKNELMTSISEKLIKYKSDLKTENQRIFQEIIHELKSNQDTDSWAEFEAHFTQVHTDFYKRLNEKFPNLSGNEKKLCAFLRLNLSTKDISAITYQSVNSITVARSRLRKKLNIEGEDVNLVNFLMQF